MKIYRIGYAGYLAGEQDVSDMQRVIPQGWTRKAPPKIPPGHYAVWTGAGWTLTDVPPPEPSTPKPEPDKQGFLQAIVEYLGAHPCNKLLQEYPLFIPAVEHVSTGETALGILQTALSADDLTEQQYDDLMELWDQCYMPRPETES